MTINLAFLADPHLCITPRRRNLPSLLDRELWKNLDTAKGTIGGIIDNPTDLILPSSFDDRPLLAAADFISQVSADLDLLVLLGDLATTGMDQDLAIAQQTFLEDSDPRHLNAALEPRFGGLNIPLHVVPGNHDRYHDDKARPGCRNFDRVFQNVYKPTNGVSTKTVIRDGITVGLISADFCFPDDDKISILRRFGRGRVDQLILSELDSQTRAWQSDHPDNPVIWALHFSPSDDVKKPLQLEEREQVIHHAQVLKVRHIFCGHTHINRRSIGTHPHIYSAGSVSSIDERDNHFLHICTIDVDEAGYKLEVHDFRYSEKKDEFLIDPISNIA